ncbi:hypothetical protein C8J57DRAFT_1528049 [Mycena rebaudengoi]|nr:hypothetical protein C8J57DRAFT_1528049 [Mycena rebaudengoi]
MSLTSVDEWKGCLDDIKQAEDSKKAGMVIPIMIQVTDQYLASVAAKTGKNKAPAVKKGKKAPILGLDHAGTDDNDFDGDLGGMEKETKFMEQLDNTYGHCQACGPTKFCKITVGGTHHHLNNGQRCAWAQSLALGKHNVTLKTPSRNVGGQNLFGMFFKTMLPDVVQPIPIPPMMQTQLGGMPAFMMPPGYPYMLLLWGVHSAAPIPITPATPTPDSCHHIRAIVHAGPSHASTSALPAAFPSSDPPDMGVQLTCIPEYQTSSMSLMDMSHTADHLPTL